MYSLAVVLRGLRPRGTWRTRGGARQSARPGQGRHAARAGRLKRIKTSVRKCRIAPALGALRTDLLPYLRWSVRPGWRGGAARDGAAPPRPGDGLQTAVSRRSTAAPAVAASATAAAPAPSARGPAPAAPPPSAAPAAPIATFAPAIQTKTCARAPGGAWRERAASVAAMNGAVGAAASAKAAMAGGRVGASAHSAKPAAIATAQRRASRSGSPPSGNAVTSRAPARLPRPNAATRVAADPGPEPSSRASSTAMTDSAP